jgi:hypothetical protein
MGMAWARTPGRLALACGLVVTLTACHDSGDDEADHSTTTEAPDSTTTTDGALVQTKDPPRTSGFVGARGDVSDLRCVASDGGWVVTGRVTNPTSETVSYRIFTSFLDEDSDTKGVVQTDVTGVAPKASATWKGELPLQADELSCVLRVERTTD